jgi:hypothetical protein
MNVCQHWEQFSSFQDCGRRERCPRFMARAGSTLQGRRIPMWSYPHCRPLAGLSRTLLLPVSHSIHLWDPLLSTRTSTLQAIQLYLVTYLVNRWNNDALQRNTEWFRKDHCGNFGISHKVTLVMGSWTLHLNVRLHLITICLSTKECAILKYIFSFCKETKLQASGLQSVNSKEKDHLRKLRYTWEHKIKHILKK